MKWDKLVYPDDMPIVEKRRQALLEGRQDTSEFRMTGKHGRSYWLRTYTYPLWDEREGRVVSIYAAVKDITAWKEAEQALVRERNLLQTILETAPDQIYVKDLDSRFVLVNPNTWQLHNLSGSSENALHPKCWAGRAGVWSRKCRFMVLTTKSSGWWESIATLPNASAPRPLCASGRPICSA
jgi:PAS domain-containing protein